MAYLEKFSDEQRKLLVSLPYRVGLFVSMSDQSGGPKSAEAERRALANIVTGFVEDFCKSEFVEEVMRQTLLSREQWDSWLHGIDTVPSQGRRAIDMIVDVMDYKEVASFKLSLMDIATSVAMAYREDDGNPDDQSFVGRVYSYLRYYANKIHARMYNAPIRTMEEILNVSKAEAAALHALRNALRLDKQEGLPVKDVTEAA